MRPEPSTTCVFATVNGADAALGDMQDQCYSLGFASLRRFGSNTMTRYADKAGHRGRCLCGAVNYRVDGPLRPVVACHCGQCQRTSGHFVAATSGRHRLSPAARARRTKPAAPGS